MYEDFLFYFKSVYFLYIYFVMWRSIEKIGFVLFFVILVFFVILIVFENI